MENLRYKLEKHFFFFVKLTFSQNRIKIQPKYCRKSGKNRSLLFRPDYELLPRFKKNRFNIGDAPRPQTPSPAERHSAPMMSPYTWQAIFLFFFTFHAKSRW